MNKKDGVWNDDGTKFIFRFADDSEDISVFDASRFYFTGANNGYYVVHEFNYSYSLSIIKYADEGVEFEKVASYQFYYPLRYN